MDSELLIPINSFAVKILQQYDNLIWQNSGLTQFRTKKICEDFNNITKSVQKNVKLIKKKKKI